MKLFFLLLIINLVLISADVTVTATGYGASKAQATQDALRNAVEQGAGVKIFSSTEVQDFIALKDVMVSESFGMVTRYDVISTEERDSKDWVVKVNASVTDNVQKDWAKMKILLQQKENPNVMVMFEEIVDGKPVYKDAGAIAIISELKKLGFRVIDVEGIAELKQLRKEVANMEQNMDAIMDIAAKRSVDFVIVGSLEATKNPNKSFYNIKGVSYTVRCYAKIRQTDTGEVVATLDDIIGGNPTQFGTLPPAQVALATLKKVTQKTPSSKKDTFFVKLMANLITHWSKENQEGKVVELTVSNVSYRDKKEVQRVLDKQEDKISNVVVKNYSHKILTIELKSKLRLEDLADALEELEDFEVVNFENGRLEIRYVH